jgi:HEAT repeat protein
MLKDKDKELREAAIWALHGTTNPQVVMPLLGVLENRQEDDNIRNEALFALACVPDRRAIGPVTRILLNADCEMMVANAGWVLARMPGQEPVEALLDCLKNNKDAMRRTSAAHGLAEIKHGRAVPALLAALKDADADVRLNAVHSLESLRESKALALLKELASKDPDGDVRKAAAAAVQRIEDTE